MPDFGIFRGFNEKLFGDKLVAGRLPTQLGIIGSQVVTDFDADYKAVLDYATTQGYTLPSSSQQLLQNQLVVNLKHSGVWDKLDIFYVFATDGDSDFASINWKDSNNHKITEVNSPTFTSNLGFSSDGISAYLDTNFNLSTDGVNYNQNDLSIFVGFPILSNTTSLVSNYAYGVSSGVYLNRRIDANFSTINNRMWSNSTTSNTTTSTFKTNDTIYFNNRTNSTSINFRNTILSSSTTESGTRSNNSTSLVNSNLYLIGGPTVIFESTANLGIMGLGSQLSTLEMIDIETAWYNNYFTNI
jgi:hypothetical protein